MGAAVARGARRRPALQADLVAARLERPLALAVIACATVALLATRRPNDLHSPQLWAEDGGIFYTDAYNQGWLHALVLPYAGYLQLFPRLAFGFAQLLPFHLVPRAMNLLALACQAAPVVYLLSARGRTIVESLAVRLALVVVYLGLPLGETHGNVTNSQWYLAILSALMLLASAPTRRWVAGVEIAVVLVAGLSGPFSIALVPLAAYRWWRRRGRTEMSLLVATAGTAAVQVGVVVGNQLDGHLRTSGNLGASASRLALIVVDRVVIPAPLGQPGPLQTHVSGRPHAAVLAVLALGLAVAVCLWGLLRGGAAVRLFSVAATLELAGALRSPVTDPLRPWLAMIQSDSGGRYFLLPQLAFLAVLIVAVTTVRPPRVRTAVAAALLGVFLFGAVSNWRYAPYRQYDLHAQQATIDHAAPGSEILIPVNPGGDWKIDLHIH